MAKMQHGSIMLPFYELDSDAEHDTSSDSYVTVAGNFRVYIPTDATTIRMAIRQKSSVSTAYAKFGVGGNYSSESTLNSGTYTWVTTSTLDVSSLDGWYDMIIQHHKSGTDGRSYVKGFSFIWE